MNRLLLTVCTYNELENIRLLIPDLRAVAPDADILVIDDNSPDGTSDAVLEFMENDSQVHLIKREGKLGLGTAALAAFQYAIDKGYEQLLNLDADFSHHPKYIPAIREAAESADVVIGSRYVTGGGIVGFTVNRLAVVGQIRRLSPSIAAVARSISLAVSEPSSSAICWLSWVSLFRVARSRASVSWPLRVGPTNPSAYGVPATIPENARSSTGSPSGPIPSNTPSIFPSAAKRGSVRSAWCSCRAAAIAVVSRGSE